MAVGWVVNDPMAGARGRIVGRDWIVKVARTFLPSPICNTSARFYWFPAPISYYLSWNNRVATPDWLAALSIVTSQFLLLVFAWLNRQLLGMWILITV
jgi:hypothetical protein